MSKFELWAFYSSLELLHKIDSPLLTGYIVDLEKKGKELRQSLYDTQITEHHLDDLTTARNNTKKDIICRINPQSPINTSEIDNVIGEGADEILLPMVRSVSEVERVLNYINNRCRLSIMLETNESLSAVEELNTLPLTRFYVGLNDLAICNHRANIFTPMIDGSLELIARKVNKKFGLAGLTHPSLGAPIPCEVIIRAMKRHRCHFGILRRSFYRDLNQYDAQEILESLSNHFCHNELDSDLQSQWMSDKFTISNAAF